MVLAGCWIINQRAVLLFGASLVAVCIAGCGGTAEPETTVARVPTVKVMTVGVVAGTSRGFPGRVRAAERVDLAFHVGGRLVELPIKQGELIERGALIAKLDARAFDANLRSARALAEEAAANFERGEGLIERDFISRADFANLRARRDTSAADLDKAEKAVEDTVITAPFTGVVARRVVENFQEVRANQLIASLQDSSVIEIVAAAPERLVAQRDEGAVYETRAVFDSIPGASYEIAIKEFATEADPQTQTFEYVLVMPRPEDVNILPGMTATVYVTATQGAPGASAGYTIPAAAVFADASGESQVWVIESNGQTVIRRTVVTGDLRGRDGIVITDGLSAGEVIAAAGVHQLREGMSVRPVTTIQY
jgi:RND family efflux transporter MFP subunit